MKKQLNPDAEGYLLDAAACKKILNDLKRLEAKYKRQVDKEQAKRQAELEAAMEFHSEREILDAYGWGLITEKQYDLYLKLFREGQAALENRLPTGTELAHGMICRIISTVDRDRREWEFRALTPEQQKKERERAENSRQNWNAMIAEIKKERGIIAADGDCPLTDAD